MPPSLQNSATPQNSPPLPKEPPPIRPPIIFNTTDRTLEEALHQLESLNRPLRTILPDAATKDSSVDEWDAFFPTKNEEMQPYTAVSAAPMPQFPLEMSTKAENSISNVETINVANVVPTTKPQEGAQLAQIQIAEPVATPIAQSKPTPQALPNKLRQSQTPRVVQDISTPMQPRSREASSIPSPSPLASTLKPIANTITKPPMQVPLPKNQPLPTTKQNLVPTPRAVPLSRTGTVSPAVRQAPVQSKPANIPPPGIPQRAPGNPPHAAQANQTMEFSTDQQVLSDKDIASAIETELNRDISDIFPTKTFMGFGGKSGLDTKEWTMLRQMPLGDIISAKGPLTGTATINAEQVAHIQQYLQALETQSGLPTARREKMPLETYIRNALGNVIAPTIRT